MFRTRHPSTTRIIGQASLRMVALDDQRHLTSQVTVGVMQLGKKGAVLALESPFIDGSHVLMDVHNITPKLAELTPLGQPDQPGVLGEVVRFDRLEQEQGGSFLVEVVFSPDRVAARQALAKSLQRPGREQNP